MAPDGSRGNPPRRYRDREVGRLLGHASELQEKDEAGERRVQEGGMTLATLQEVAAEAGIDPRYVQLAAARIDGRKPRGFGEVFFGTPLVVRCEQVIPGQLPDEDFEYVCTEIEMATGLEGYSSTSRSTLKWKSAGTEWIRGLLVRVVSRNGETRIHAEERLESPAVVATGGLAVGGGLGAIVGVGLGGLGAGLLAALFTVTLIGGVYVAMRRVMKSTGRKRRAELEGLVERIAGYVKPLPD